MTSKSVSLDGNTWSYTSPAQDIGEDVYYRISITNFTLRTLRPDIVLLDVLPHANDHTIAANAQGDYPARQWTLENGDGTSTVMEHSAFSTPLTGPIQSATAVLNGVQSDASNRFTFTYTTTAQGADLASIRDATYVDASQITDWSAVTAFKITLNADAHIQPGESVSFVTHNSIPATQENMALRSGSRAVNSAAVSSDGKGYSEANNATVEMVRYEVKGTVFTDMNRDGNLDTDDWREGQVAVSLVDADTGAQIVNPDGVPVTGVTEENGTYHFNVYKRGHYRVRVDFPDGAEFTKLGDGDDSVANHVGLCSTADARDPHNGSATSCSSQTARVGWTSDFTLNPTHRIATRNAGTVFHAPELEIPLTGGCGRDFYIIAGGTLLVLGVVWALVRKRRA